MSDRTKLILWKLFRKVAELAIKLIIACFIFKLLEWVARITGIKATALLVLGAILVANCNVLVSREKDK